MINYLISNTKYDINQKNEAGDTSLESLYKVNDVYMIERLVKNEDFTFDLSALSKSNFELSRIVVNFLVKNDIFLAHNDRFKEKFSKTNWLLEQNLLNNIDITTYNDLLLNVAAFPISFNCFEKLTEHKLFNKDTAPTNLLHVCVCVEKDNLEGVKLLIDKKDWDINKKTGGEENTALLKASKSMYQFEIIKYLVQNPKCDINLKDSYNNTALQVICERAIGCDDYHTIKLLIMHDAKKPSPEEIINFKPIVQEILKKSKSEIFLEGENGAVLPKTVTTFMLCCSVFFKQNKTPHLKLPKLIADKIIADYLEDSPSGVSNSNSK